VEPPANGQHEQRAQREPDHHAEHDPYDPVRQQVAARVPDQHGRAGPQRLGGQRAQQEPAAVDADPPGAQRGRRTARGQVAGEHQHQHAVPGEPPFPADDAVVVVLGRPARAPVRPGVQMGEPPPEPVSGQVTAPRAGQPGREHGDGGQVPAGRDDTGGDHRRAAGQYGQEQVAGGDAADGEVREQRDGGKRDLREQIGPPPGSSGLRNNLA